MKRYLLLFIVGWISLTLSAVSVSKEQAKQNVIDFLSQKGQAVFKSKSADRVSRKNVSVQPALTTDSSLYVFNVSGGGFVLASGDDVTEPILGYCDEGSFDVDNIPDGLKEMLQLYQEEIAYARKLNLPQRKVTATHDAVDYFVTSTWNQSAPYNNRCPMDGTSRSLTGCVATALAQAIYYTRYPTSACSVIPAYTTQTTQTVMAQLDATTFDWSALKDSYNADETGTSVDEVSKLMLYCGQAMTMNYNSAYSGASGDVSGALKAYFGYDLDCRFVSRLNYTDVAWDEMIYQEIAARRAIVYSAATLNGVGHAFVVDGYDGNGNYHVNWGWGGGSNGYFKLSALTPGLINGGSPSHDGYTIYPTAVIGIDKPTAYTGVTGLEISSLQATNSSSTKNKISVNFTASGLIYNFKCSNPTKTAYKFHVILSLYDNNGNYKQSFDDRYYFDINAKSTHEVGPMEQYYGANLSAGTYQIRADYQICNSEGVAVTERKPCINSDKYYIQLTVSEDQLTATYQNVAPATVTTTAGYTINSITFGTDPMTTFPTTCTLNITNTGTANYSVINMYENTNENTSPTTAIGVFIDPGETDNVVLHFTPATSGDAVTYVFTGTGFTNTTTTTKIKALPETNVSVDGSFGNYEYWDNGILRYKGNIMVVHANYTNLSKIDRFTGKIFVQLFGLSALDGNNETVAEILTKSQTMNLATGESGSLTFTFDGLNYDYIYRVSLGYIDIKNVQTTTKYMAGNYFHLMPDPFTIQTIDYATYCNARPWKVPEGVTAYIATGTKTENEIKKLTLEPLTSGTIIPANMGVLLHGAKGSYNFDFETDDSVTINPATNYFVGTTAAVTPTAEAGYKYYRLSADDSDNNGVYDNNVGFYYGAEDGAAFTIAANRAYLKLPTSLAAKSGNFVFDDENTLTAISLPHRNPDVGNGCVYDIAGRKVTNSLERLPKGIYVRNGKKIIIK